MKKFIIGFITGGIICAAVTGFAVEYAVTANPYPVKVNGVEKSIEGYNINDSTYFKLRDIADAVGGFTVGFTDNTITIDAAEKTAPAAVQMPAPSKSAPANVSSELNKDGTRKYSIDGIIIDYYDGVGYVDVTYIEKIYDIGLIAYDGIVDKHMNKIELTIPTHPDHISLIPLDFYEITMYPLLLTITE